MIHAAGDQGGNGNDDPMREKAARSKPLQQTHVRQLQPVLQQAFADWLNAYATATQPAQLRQVPVSIQSLPASYLGKEAGNQVWISPNTTGRRLKLGASSPTGRMDIGSVIGHKSGNVLGLEDNDNLQDVIV